MEKWRPTEEQPLKGVKVSGESNNENYGGDRSPTHDHQHELSTKHTSPCLRKAGDNEPIFVLRSTDKLAPALIEHWAALAELHGTKDEKVSGAIAHANQMRQWQHDNPTKVKWPD